MGAQCAPDAWPTESSNLCDLGALCGFILLGGLPTEHLSNFGFRGAAEAMDQKQYYALVLREANQFIEPREERLKAARQETGHLRDFEAELEAQLRAFLTGTDDLLELIRFSMLEKKPPALWRDAPDWESVLFRVAYACLLHDVMESVERVLDGRLPRVAPEQIVIP